MFCCLWKATTRRLACLLAGSAPGCGRLARGGFCQRSISLFSVALFRY